MSYSRRQGDKRRQRIQQKRKKGKKNEKEEARKLRELKQKLRSPNHEIARKQNSAGPMKDRRVKRKKRNPTTDELIQGEY